MYQIGTHLRKAWGRQTRIPDCRPGTGPHAGPGRCRVLHRDNDCGQCRRRGAQEKCGEIVCLFSAIRQGQVCANGIIGISQGHDIQTNTMVYAALPEFYAILALVAALIDIVPLFLSPNLRIMSVN